MTAIAFHFNAPDKLLYACRLLRKAVASGARVAVTAPADVLQQLDGLLWTFSLNDFVPHAISGDAPTVLAASPVLLTEAPTELVQRQVLLNLGLEVPVGFDQFERLIEVVSLDDAHDRERARGRWKHYAQLGYALDRKDLELKDSNP